MATPLVSGVVALMLQAEPSLSPVEVKTYSVIPARRKVVHQGLAFQTDGIQIGFGSLDTSCAVDTVLGGSCTPLTDGGGEVELSLGPSK